MRRSLLLALAVALGATSLTQSSLAAFTSSSGSASSGVTAAIDWTPPTVALRDPGPVLRGTVTLTADASDADTDLSQVTVERREPAADGWTHVCAATASGDAFSCDLATTGVGDGVHELRAVATDTEDNTATSAVATVMVDNAAPTVSVSAPSGTLSGTVTISASATDVHSGVGTVTIQRRFGAADWVAICDDATAPYGCRLDTTQVEEGTYEFRAIAHDVAGNTATSASISRGVANGAASIAVQDPGVLLAGTVTVEASVDSPIAIADVRIQRTTGGTADWTDLCVDVTAPHACSWDTTGVPDGPYDLRAILTDVHGVTTVSEVLPGRYVDNAPLRGLDVQAANGGVPGRIDQADALTLTYSDRLDLTSVIAGWDGSARAVTVRLRDGGAIGGEGIDDTLDVFVGTEEDLRTPAHVGSVNLGADHIKNGRTATILGTLSASTVVVDGTEVTVLTVVVEEEPHNNVARRTVGEATMRWTPSPAVRRWTGAPGSATPVTELGPLDEDL